MKGTAINIQAELISITREIRDKRMGRACKGGRTMKSRRFFFFFALTQNPFDPSRHCIPLSKGRKMGGGCASRNFLIEEKKLYLNGPCKSVASRWRSRITYTVESCYANSQQRFVFLPPGIRLEKGCPIHAKDSTVVRSILRTWKSESCTF